MNIIPIMIKIRPRTTNTFPARIIIVSVGFLFSIANLFAGNIRVENPGNHHDIQPAIQEALSRAVDGDNIILPSGEFIFNKGIVVTKFISITGKGLTKTILYRPDDTPDSILSKRDWVIMFSYEINSTLPSNIVVSGITFRSRKPSVVIGDGGSRAGCIGIRMNQCVSFLIEKCRFEYFANAAIEVRHNDTLANGLIRKNKFYYNAGAGLGYGIAVYGTNKKWVPDPKFGSSNFIFVEDNVFDFHRHSVAAGGCALYVFRHNTILNNIAASGGHAIDTHEARKGDGSPFGTRAVEIYSNKLLNSTYTDGTPIEKAGTINKSILENAGVAIRNGDAVVFDNEVRGYLYGVSISNWYLHGTVQTYPVLYSPGYSSGAALGPGHSGIDLPEGDGDAFFGIIKTAISKKVVGILQLLFTIFNLIGGRKAGISISLRNPGIGPFLIPTRGMKSEARVYILDPGYLILVHRVICQP